MIINLIVLRNNYKKIILKFMDIKILTHILKIKSLLVHILYRISNKEVY